MILYCIFWVLSFKHIHLNSVNNIGYGKITTFQYQIICYAYKNKHIISPRVKSLIQVNISNMGYLMINGGFEISEVVFQFQFRKARMFFIHRLFSRYTGQNFSSIHEWVFNMEIVCVVFTYEMLLNVCESNWIINY